MKELQVVYKNISELNPYENNPRFNDEAVEYVANSIKEFGFKNPIILGKDNVIVCGHTRWKAAQKLGMKYVPCRLTGCNYLLDKAKEHTSDSMFI